MTATTDKALHKVGELFPDLFGIHCRHRDDALVVGHMADALAEAQHLDLALALYGWATALAPRAVHLHQDHAAALTEAGQYEAAAAKWEIVSAIAPADPEPRRQLAQLLHVYLGRSDAAVSVLKEIVRRAAAPQDYQLLAQCFVAERTVGATVARVQEALDGQGDSLAVYQGVADALVTFGRFEEAEAVARFVLARSGENSTSLSTLALAHVLQGAPDRARSALERALTIDPADTWVILLTFCTLYSLGAYEESRDFCLRSLDVWIEAHPPYTAQTWRGESLAGKRILLHHERHGFGDAIQFARLAAPLAERGARVFVAARKPITSFLARCRGVEKAFSKYDTAPAVDYECEAYLPWVLLPIAAGELAAVVPPVPVDSRRVAARRARLIESGCLSVGIAWEGTDARSWRPRTSACRSIPLVAFQPLARLDRVRLYSLLPRNPELGTWNVLSNVTLVDLTDDFTDFLSLAETIAALDVVISVDTAVAHLAGAVGTRACVLLPFAAEWRWEQQRTDCPWYPSARLFRQRQPGVWSDVIHEVVQYLETLIPQHRPTGERSGAITPPMSADGYAPSQTSGSAFAGALGVRGRGGSR